MKPKAKYDLILIHPSYNRRLYSGVIYPLGLGYLSAAVSAEGFFVKIIDCAGVFGSLENQSLIELRHWLKEQLICNSPKLAIGIGPCTTSAVRSIRIISELCKAEYQELPLLYGGPLASIPGQEDLFFNEFLADALVPGDGENVLCNILHALQANKSLDRIEGVVTRNNKKIKKNIVNQLDVLPFPIRPNIDENNIYRPSTRRNIFIKPFATMLVSRGCPYSCSYCVSGLLREGLYHRRSVDNIINEIENLVNHRGIKSIIFYDDTFFPYPNTLEKNVIDFSEALQQGGYNLKWQIEMRPDVFVALDKYLLIKLYSAGCTQINIGIEKSEVWASKALDKIISPERVRSKCDEINTVEPKMLLTSTFIFGGPGETETSIKGIIEYAMSLKLLYAHFYPLELYPGTRLYKDLNKTKDRFWWYRKILSDELNWGEILYEANGLDRDALLYWISCAYNSFYNRPSWRSFAKNKLKHNFYKVEKQALSWAQNRFQIT